MGRRAIVAFAAFGAALGTTSPVFAVDSLTYHFVEEGRSQGFLGGFSSPADPDCILEVLWEPGHLAAYVSGVDSVQVVTASEDTQLVRYRAHWWFLDQTSVYCRRLRHEEGRVDFDLLASSASGPGVPRLISSRGGYRVVPRSPGCRVMYEEHAVFDGSLFSGLASRAARQRAVAFLHGLARYVEENCERLPAPKAGISERGGGP